MRILWISDPPLAPTGYGNQASLFIPRLRAAGHAVALFATGGSAGAKYDMPDGLQVYPTVGDPRGNDMVALHAKDFRADVVLTLGDPHACDPNVYGKLPWLAWAPLDFETPTQATRRSLCAARWVWSPSRHGRDAYVNSKALEHTDYVAYVPCGIDSTLAFDLRAHRDLRTCLQLADGTPLEDVFLIVSVAANKGTPSRKGFYELLAAFKAFHDRHAEARLYLHTEIAGIAGGEDLRQIMALVGLDPRLVTFPPQYEYLTGKLTSLGLAALYSATDVYLSASHGEGFGLPIVEAQMCGCPVVAPRNSAQAEVVLTGQLVDTMPYHPFDGATTWRRPSVEGLVGGLEAVYKRTKLGWGNDRAETRAKAMIFDVDRVFQEYMLPELKKIEGQLWPR